MVRYLDITLVAGSADTLSFNVLKCILEEDNV